MAGGASGSGRRFGVSKPPPSTHHCKVFIASIPAFAEGSAHPGSAFGNRGVPAGAFSNAHGNDNYAANRDGFFCNPFALRRVLFDACAHIKILAGGSDEKSYPLAGPLGGDF